MEKEHFDFATPESGKPFLVGYRKFLVALLWLCLAVFVVLYGMLGKPSSGQLTLAIWVVGSAGFFCAFFVGGNVLVHKWGEFWEVHTSSRLFQEDSTENYNESIKESYDPNEHAAWKDAESQLPPLSK